MTTFGTTLATTFATTFEWKDDGLCEGQVLERQFVIKGGKKPVPGIMWAPEVIEKPVPLVLFGHGGSGHKRVARALMLGRRFAGVSQFAMVAIDGPAHGDRKNPGEYDQAAAMSEGGVENVVDGMVADWTVTLDHFSGMDLIDAGRVAYIGFSMGTRFGLPFVAAAGGKLRCAALGKNALAAKLAASAPAHSGDRLSKDAPKIKIPLLFHMQWDDELFARDSQCDLFDLIGSEDKRLISYPGPHARSTSESVDHWCAFIENHLKV
jgi:dienelactone hydrolase